MLLSALPIVYTYIHICNNNTNNKGIGNVNAKTLQQVQMKLEGELIMRVFIQ
jgi:hypothetical protein